MEPRVRFILIFTIVAVLIGGLGAVLYVFVFHKKKATVKTNPGRIVTVVDSETNQIVAKAIEATPTSVNGSLQLASDPVVLTEGQTYTMIYTGDWNLKTVVYNYILNTNAPRKLDNEAFTVPPNAFGTITFTVTNATETIRSRRYDVVPLSRLQGASRLSTRATYTFIVFTASTELWFRGIPRLRYNNVLIPIQPEVTTGRLSFIWSNPSPAQSAAPLQVVTTKLVSLGYPSELVLALSSPVAIVASDAAVVDEGASLSNARITTLDDDDQPEFVEPRSYIYVRFNRTAAVRFVNIFLSYTANTFGVTPDLANQSVSGSAPVAIPFMVPHTPAQTGDAHPQLYVKVVDVNAPDQFALSLPLTIRLGSSWSFIASADITMTCLSNSSVAALLIPIEAYVNIGTVSFYQNTDNWHVTLKKEDDTVIDLGLYGELSYSAFSLDRVLVWRPNPAKAGGLEAVFPSTTTSTNTVNGMTYWYKRYPNQALSVSFANSSPKIYPGAIIFQRTQIPTPGMAITAVSFTGQVQPQSTITLTVTGTNMRDNSMIIFLQPNDDPVIPQIIPPTRVMRTIANCEQDTTFTTSALLPRTSGTFVLAVWNVAKQVLAFKDSTLISLTPQITGPTAIQLLRADVSQILPLSGDTWVLNDVTNEAFVVTNGTTAVDLTDGYRPRRVGTDISWSPQGSLYNPSVTLTLTYSFNLAGFATRFVVPISVKIADLAAANGLIARITRTSQPEYIGFRYNDGVQLGYWVGQRVTLDVSGVVPAPTLQPGVRALLYHESVEIEVTNTITDRTNTQLTVAVPTIDDVSAANVNRQWRWALINPSAGGLYSGFFKVAPSFYGIILSEPDPDSWLFSVKFDIFSSLDTLADYTFEFCTGPIASPTLFFTYTATLSASNNPTVDAARKDGLIAGHQTTAQNNGRYTGFLYFAWGPTATLKDEIISPFAPCTSTYTFSQVRLKQAGQSVRMIQTDRTFPASIVPKKTKVQVPRFPTHSSGFNDPEALLTAITFSADHRKLVDALSPNVYHVEYSVPDAALPLDQSEYQKPLPITGNAPRPIQEFAQGLFPAGIKYLNIMLTVTCTKARDSWTYKVEGEPSPLPANFYTQYLFWVRLVFIESNELSITFVAGSAPTVGYYRKLRQFVYLYTPAGGTDIYARGREKYGGVLLLTPNEESAFKDLTVTNNNFFTRPAPVDTDVYTEPPLLCSVSTPGYSFQYVKQSDLRPDRIAATSTLSAIKNGSTITLPATYTYCTLAQYSCIPFFEVGTEKRYLSAFNIENIGIGDIPVDSNRKVYAAWYTRDAKSGEWDGPPRTIEYGPHAKAGMFLFDGRIRFMITKPTSTLPPVLGLKCLYLTGMVPDYKVMYRVNESRDESLKKDQTYAQTPQDASIETELWFDRDFNTKMRELWRFVETTTDISWHTPCIYMTNLTTLANDPDTVTSFTGATFTGARVLPPLWGGKGYAWSEATTLPPKLQLSDLTVQRYKQMKVGNSAAYSAFETSATPPVDTYTYDTLVTVRDKYELIKEVFLPSSDTVREIRAQPIFYDNRRGWSASSVWVRKPQATQATYKYLMRSKIRIVSQNFFYPDGQRFATEPLNLIEGKYE